MNTKRRWMKSMLEESANCEVALPWARHARPTRRGQAAEKFRVQR